jgi:4-hydroxy-tetrahydrodipicolinate reductase
VTIDIVVSGATGRMGRALGRLILDAADLRSVGGIARRSVEEGAEAAGFPGIVDVEHAGDLLRSSQCLIDFSAPRQLRRILELHAEALQGHAVLVGTTGLDAEAEAALERLAQDAAVLTAPNFSIGVNLLLGLVEQAARALGPAGYDVEIVEAHHAGKVDAPSGTALALGRAVAAGRGRPPDDNRREGRTGLTGARTPGEIGFHSLRGGAVVGEHTVHFLGERERILLGHMAESRDLFADGALIAARWLTGRPPGRYTMADVLDPGD